MGLDYKKETENCVDIEASEMSAYRMFLYEIVTPIMRGLIVLLNVIEIVFIGRTEKRKKVGTIYILNLSISDVIVGLMMILLKSMDPFMKGQLKNNLAAKEVYGVIRYCFIRLSLFVSIFNLIALTIDRVWAVTKPFSHRQKTSSFAVKICLLVWLLSVVSVTTFFCVVRFYVKDIERYNNLVFPIATYSTTAVFVICYNVIFKTIRKSRKMQRENTFTTPSEEAKGEKVNNNSVHDRAEVIS